MRKLQIARKSSSKIRPVILTPSSHSGNSVENIEQKGRLIPRSNHSHREIDFVAHQCDKQCVAHFPYKTDDSRSKQFF